MENLLELFLVAVAVVIGGQLLLERAAPVYARVGSLVPIGLGVFVGTVESAFASSTLDRALAPLSALGLVLLGFFAGLRVGERRSEPGNNNVNRMGVLAALVSFLGVGSLSFVGLELTGWLEQTTATRVVVACALGACAAAAGAHPLAVVLEARGWTGRGGPRGALSAAWMLEATAIVVAGVAIGFHQPDADPMAAFSATEWMVVSLLVGAGLGILLSALVSALDERLGATTVVAFVLVGAGACHSTGLSPLLLGLVAGLAVRLTRPDEPPGWVSAEVLERPVHLLVLFLAAAAWTYGGGEVIAAAGVFVLLQLMARVAGSWWAFRSQVEPLTWQTWPGPLLLPQGGLPVAIALSLGLHFGLGTAEGAVLLTGALGAVLLNEAIAASASVRLGRQFEWIEEDAGLESEMPGGGDGTPAGEAEVST